MPNVRKGIQEFVKSYSRPTQRLTTAQRSNPARCAVEVNGRRCPSKSATRNLCETHYRQWNKRSRRSPRVTLAEWMASGEVIIPDEPLPDCIVPACRRESMTSTTKVCRLDWNRYMRGRCDEPIEVWARQQLPHIGVHEFMLLNLRAHQAPFSRHRGGHRPCWSLLLIKLDQTAEPEAQAPKNAARSGHAAGSCSGKRWPPS